MNRLSGLFVALILVSTGAYSALAEGSLAIDLGFETKYSKVGGLILPGDLVKFTVNVRSAELTSGNVTLIYDVTCLPAVSSVQRGYVVVKLLNGVGSAGFDVEVPWCRSLAVEVSAVDAHAASSRLIVDIGPEVRLSLVEPRDPFLGERREGGILIIRVLARTNVDKAYGSLIAMDETLGLKLYEKRVELVDKRVYEIYIKLPENPRRLLIFKDLLVLHNISIYVLSDVDSYADNNVVNLYVIIASDDLWRIPWAVSVVVGFFVVIVALAYIARKIYS